MCTRWSDNPALGCCKVDSLAPTLEYVSVADVVNAAGNKPTFFFSFDLARQDEREDQVLVGSTNPCERERVRERDREK